jgi:outer membrane lipoprotein SlyB
MAKQYGPAVAAGLAGTAAAGIAGKMILNKMRRKKCAAIKDASERKACMQKYKLAEMALMLEADDNNLKKNKFTRKDQG